MPILEPDVLNPTILFLASDESNGITGEKIIGKDFDSWLDNR
jgi:gluconate 5-dehydrogenase